MRLTSAIIITLSATVATTAMTLPTTSQSPAQTTPSGCCGQQMTFLGEASVYQVTAGKSSDGTSVPLDLRTEVYGKELQAKVDLPPGVYTVEIVASENSITKPAKRLFNVSAYSGTTGTTIAKDVDLLLLAGGQGKEYTARGKVTHAGGTLRVVLTATVDNAKFSAIRILDESGNKAAWLFADDVAELLKAPDEPPPVAGPALWRDESQSFEKRAADLVRHMTLKEKVRQMQSNAPAIPRLGIPAYNYWSEALHGVARNGYATVFPQAIGMAATWDPDSLHTVGDTIATEARAKYNAWQAEGGYDFYGGTYRGLTFWSPNINLFRDPRWGRGQETYGEDPFLTGTMGVAFIKGLQGDDPKYFKTIATAKHFAVHSGPELLRHKFDATPPERDFYESYLPHFEMAAREGKVYSFMGAYNRVFGAPACASDLLLEKLLRKAWGFEGYVVSDCGAINDIWAHHESQPDRASAAAAAVLAGCDLECSAGGACYQALPLAVDRNLIGEGVIDQSLTRVLVSRFKLGLFDAPARVSFNAIKPAENATPAHAALALQMARESIVLLKNDGVLPLNRSGKIAIVGPNADGLLPLLGNYNGTPVAPVTVADGIRTAFTGTILRVRGCDNAPRNKQWPDTDWQLIPDVCLRPTPTPPIAAETGLKAEHWNNEEFQGPPVTSRNEKQVDFQRLIEWTLSGIPIQSSSSRWSGEFVAPADGEYHLTAMGSTPFRLTVADTKITDGWSSYADKPTPATQATTQPTSDIVLQLKAGQAVPLTLESHQAGGSMNLQLLWNRADIDVTKLAADRVKDADTILFVGGLDGRMEAEEGDSRGTFEGFDNGDRLAIELPACQTALLKALVATGKPVIFINMTGSATAMPWEADHVQGFLQSWYPGQAGGTAIADILFGNVSPSGRLPVTFYRSTADLPPFEDYAMKDRTYRYFTGKPQWPFGFGLSYTTFKYDALTIDKPIATAADTLKVTVNITNTGNRPGDEVVQLYAKLTKPNPGDAHQRLIGFKRISLQPGATTRAEITLPATSLRTWDVDKKAYIVASGTYELSAAASSTDSRAMIQFQVK